MSQVPPEVFAEVIRKRDLMLDALTLVADMLARVAKDAETKNGEEFEQAPVFDAADRDHETALAICQVALPGLAAAFANVVEGQTGEEKATALMAFVVMMTESIHSATAASLEQLVTESTEGEPTG